MKGDQTTLDLFEGEEVEVYETMSLNTQNLIEEEKLDAELEKFDTDELKSSDQSINNSSEINARQEKEASSEKNPKEESVNETLKKEINDLEKTAISVIDQNDQAEFIDKMMEISNYGQVNIMAIGVGGCGVNTIDRMQGEHFKNIKLVAIDTSRQSLDNTSADLKILIGEKAFNGHGSGNEIDKATDAFLEAADQIRSILKNIDMVFVTGGIGRGTGSAGLIEVGKIARELGILTIGFATLPRAIEANIKLVEQYYQLFMDAVDSNIIIENDVVNKVAHDLPIGQAMKVADKMLVDGIKGISDLITNPGKINLDYADIQTAFSNQGSCVMGIGYGEGDGAVAKAIEDSIDSEMIDFKTIYQAQTIIFNITCAPNTVTIREASEGTELIYSKNDDANNIKHMLFGYSYDESLGDKVKVTFIATGTDPKTFEEYKDDINKKNSLFSSSNKNISVDIFSPSGDKGNKPDFFR